MLFQTTNMFLPSKYSNTLQSFLSIFLIMEMFLIIRICIIGTYALGNNMQPLLQTIFLLAVIKFRLFRLNILLPVFIVDINKFNIYVRKLTCSCIGRSQIPRHNVVRLTCCWYTYTFYRLPCPRLVIFVIKRLKY